MKVTLNLTEEHLKLIPFIRINDNDFTLSIDKTRPFILSSSVLDDISLILGWQGLAIPSTQNDENGRAFPDEVEKKMLDIYHYLKDNMYYIETLVHQFVVQGGLTAGTYVCDDRENIWSKI